MKNKLTVCGVGQKKCNIHSCYNVTRVCYTFFCATVYTATCLIVADYATLTRASRDVHDALPRLKFFNARWVLIATWHNVTFYNASTQPYPVFIHTCRSLL